MNAEVPPCVLAFLICRYGLLSYGGGGISQERINFAGYINYIIRLMFFFLIIPLAGLAYALWHVWCVLPWPALWRWVTVSVCLLSFLTLFLNMFRMTDRLPMPLSVAVYELGGSSLFVLLYVVMAFLLLDLGRLVRLVPRGALYSNGITAGVIAAVIAAVFIYGNIHYYRKQRQTVSLTTDKPLDKELKIVMLSDLHLGYHNRGKELKRWVDIINGEHPDLILIGGDIIDNSLRPVIADNMAAELHRLGSPVYACLGNHEYYSGEPEAARFYKEAGITLLRDSAVTVKGINIVGRDDRTNRRRRSIGRLMRGVDKSRYTILLDHQPYHLEGAERTGVDFQFSGHTHYGQVWPVSWITDAIYEDAYGPWQRGDTRYYVSSGMGIWGGKFRIGTCSEYVVVTVKHS